GGSLPPPDGRQQNTGPCPERDMINIDRNANGNIPSKVSSSTMMQYNSGVVNARSRDVGSAGFGVPMGFSRSWTSNPAYATKSPTGNGTVVSELPYAIRDSHGTVAIISNGMTARFFDPSGGGSFTPRFFMKESFTENTTTKEYTFYDTTGDKLVFNN